MPLLCVFCRQRPVNQTWRPFCSERCQHQDLAKWIDGSYRMPGQTAQDEKERDDEAEEDT